RSAEIDELRAGKRGWARNSAAKGSGARADRRTGHGAKGGTPPTIAAKPVKKRHNPKNPMEFERDWRRLPDETAARMRYICACANGCVLKDGGLCATALLFAAICSLWG